MGRLRLRPIQDGDLDQLFAFERDPAAVQMAAFTRADPSDRQAFDAHYRRVRANPQNTLYAIEYEGVLVGQIASFTIEDSREVSYWVDPTRWGQGLAGAALDAFLEIERTRPLFARVAEHNVASASVLRRAGFAEIGRETSYADGVAHEVEEHIYRREQ
jgi:RimJ/RimL family protein N-acetyltransferase